jgi:hypothetical protein
MSFLLEIQPGESPFSLLLCADLRDLHIDQLGRRLKQNTTLNYAVFL